MANGPSRPAYFQAVADQQQLGAQNLQMAGMLSQLQDAAAKRQQASDYQSAISGANTPEQLAEIAARFSGPQGVLQHADRRAALDVKKASDQGRLLETARMNDSLISHRISQEQNANQRLLLERQRDQMRNFYNQKSLEIGGQKLFYDTGQRVDTTAPVGVAPPPVARSTAPTDAAAYQRVMEAENAGQQASVTVPAQAPRPAPTFAPALGPTPEPTPAAVPRPVYEDANDRQMAGGAMARSPVSAPIPSAAVTAPQSPVSPAAPVIPPMPPEIASAPLKVQNQWRLNQTKASIAGSGSFTPQALNFVAKQYLSGDRQAAQGFARSATARIALQNEIVDEAVRQGLSPEAVAAKIADFAGTMAGSRSTGVRSANIALAATEAEEMIPIVKEQSDKFGRTNFVPWNMALRSYESGTGTPEIAAFGASVNALVNVYARAINPTGVPTVSDKEHARAVLNTVQSPAQVDAVLGIIKRELEIAKKAPRTVQEATRQRITGGQPATTNTGSGASVSNW